MILPNSCWKNKDEVYLIFRDELGITLNLFHVEHLPNKVVSIAAYFKVTSDIKVDIKLINRAQCSTWKSFFYRVLDHDLLQWFNTVECSSFHRVEFDEIPAEHLDAYEQGIQRYHDITSNI